jgi:hypothetical protein
VSKAKGLSAEEEHLRWIAGGGGGERENGGKMLRDVNEKEEPKDAKDGLGRGTKAE